MIHVFLILMMLTFPFSAYAQEVKETTYDRVMRTQTIRCGYLVYSPFIKMDVNTKELSGLTVETMEEIGKQLGLKIEWAEELSLSTAFETINMNRYDMLCIPFWMTPPRIKVSQPTVPMYFDGYFAFSRKGDDRFKGGYKSIDDPTVTIAVQEGAAIQHMVPSYFPKSKVIEEMALTNPTQQLMDVMTKKADVAFVEMTTFKDFEKTNPDKVQVTSTTPFMVMPATLWVPRDDIRLKLLLDHEIMILQSSGKMDALLEKYGGRKFFSYVRSPAEPTMQ